MKKLLVIALIAIMVMACTGASFADEITSPDTAGSTNVTYSAEANYTVMIPAEIALSTSSTNLEVSAANVTLPEDTDLKVTVASINNTGGSNWKVVNGRSGIAYTITNGQEPVTKGGTALTVTSGSNSGASTLMVQTTQDKINKATIAGAHSDTLTFTVTTPASIT